MGGVVLKRLRSRYRPGERSRDWAKVKCPGVRSLARAIAQKAFENDDAKVLNRLSETRQHSTKR
jgi:ATP-dependent DNA ligase